MSKPPFAFKKEFDIVDKPSLKEFNPEELIKQRRKNDFEKMAKLSEEQMTKLDSELMNRFDAMKNNNTTLQDKNELYELIHKKKNIDKLYFLLSDKRQSFSLHETPLHHILIRLFQTLEKIFRNLIDQKSFVLTPSDKFYIGLTFFLAGIMLAVMLK